MRQPWGNPSDTFMWAAVGALGLPLLLELDKRKPTANFVGRWVPTLCVFGPYKKPVKLEGSDSSKVDGRRLTG